MVFNSFQYLFFLPAVLLGYFLLPQRFRWAFLLAASYYFYMSWNPNLVVLITFTTATSYLSALFIERAGENQKKRKLVLLLGVGSSLLCLFFFKYFNFVSANLAALLQAFSLPVQGVALKVMLPVGISFYTFQTLSYVIDVYRGTMPAQHHFGIYALYVSFFPQLVAGPIERATNLLPQFFETHTVERQNFTEGLQKILWGLFKKVVIADFFAPYVDVLFTDMQRFAGFPLVFATFLFGIQIYCDFSGYSDIAIGSAQILGFRLMENFKSPYTATSIKEFWRRWHISLSTWFSDYVYIPLGGSRVPRAKHLRNLFVTFLLSGLWHGAAWNFLLWGALHGLLLCAEVFVLPRRAAFLARQKPAAQKWWNSFFWLCTTGLVFAGWAVFRAGSLTDIGYFFTHFYGGLNPATWVRSLLELDIALPALAQMLSLSAILALWDFFGRKAGNTWEKLNTKPAFVRYTIYYLLACAVCLRVLTNPVGVSAPFIYFQF